jgi:hypothetical protein
MDSNAEFLIDAPLIADPDEDQLLGGGVEAIADHDLSGSRLLLVRRAMEAVDIEGTAGGAVELLCTFQPGAGARFQSARLKMRITRPDGLRFADVQPHKVVENDPIKFSLDNKGKLGFKKFGVDASAERGGKTEYVVYHCAVQGSGGGTSSAWWDFTESKVAKSGLPAEQSIAFTLAGTGQVNVQVTVTARIRRDGLAGALAATRDLILGPTFEKRQYNVTLSVPEKLAENAEPHFLRLGANELDG